MVLAELSNIWIVWAGSTVLRLLSLYQWESHQGQRLENFKLLNSVLINLIGQY